MSKKRNKPIKKPANNAAQSSQIKTNDAVSTYITSKPPVTYDNTSEDIIRINVSKARLIYRGHIQNRTDTSNIWSWFGVGLSCLIAVASSDFERTKDFYESAPVFLRVIFTIACIYSFCETAWLFYQYMKNRNKYTEDTFITELKLKRDVTDIDIVDAGNEGRLSELTSIQKNT